jgi:hypothetical protein
VAWWAEEQGGARALPWEGPKKKSRGEETGHPPTAPPVLL